MTCQFLNYPNLKLYKFDDITVQLVVQCRTCLLSCWLPSIFADEADHPHNGLKYFLRNNSNFCTWFQVSNNVSDLANICVPWSWFNVCFVNNSPSERISAQWDAVSYCGSHPRALQCYLEELGTKALLVHSIQLGFRLFESI